MNTIIEKIRAEIERISSRAMNEEGQDICEYLLSFLSSIEEKSEKLSAERDKDMIESIEMWLHECLPKYVEKELAWLKELRTRLIEEETPNDLEEAALKFVGYDMDTDDLRDYEIGVSSFKAGAEWQKAQSDKELSEKISAAYQLGLADKEKQMMKEAVEGEVLDLGINYLDLSLFDAEKIGIKEGDKVRIIVLQKED